MRSRRPCPTPLLLVLALAALASACKERKLPERYVDPRLGVFIDEFLADADRHGTPIGTDVRSKLRVVSFVQDLGAKQEDYGQEASQEDDLAGLCTSAELDSTIGAGKASVTTRTRRWKEIWIAAEMGADPELTLRELMYHELGHCLLGRDHAPAKPHTIMSPAVSSDQAWLRKHWSRLVSELFLPAGTR